MTSPIISCSVCGEALEPHTEAFCNDCGLPYHLNQRTDRPGQDCGEVWINEEHLALEFACNSCLHPEPESAVTLADILDIAEAAMVAGLTEADMATAAESGEVRHRRTTSGIYLFERRDVTMFIQGRR